MAALGHALRLLVAGTLHLALELASRSGTQFQGQASGN